MQGANAVPVPPPSLGGLQVVKEATVGGLSFLDPARSRKDAMAAQGSRKQESFWGFILSPAEQQNLWGVPSLSSLALRGSQPQHAHCPGAL